VYTRVLEYLVYIYAGSYGQIVEAVLMAVVWGTIYLSAKRVLNLIFKKVFFF